MLHEEQIPPFILKILDSQAFKRLPDAEDIRNNINPEFVVPPFSWKFVEIALNYYIKHNKPLLEYAYPPEHYDTIWILQDYTCQGAYPFTLHTEEGRDLLEEKIEQLAQTLEYILKGKVTEWRNHVECEDESIIEEMLYWLQDEVLHAPECYEIPPEVAQRHQHAPIEERIKLVITHFPEDPCYIPDFQWWLSEYFREFALPPHIARLIPHLAPAATLDGTHELPIGECYIVDCSTFGDAPQLAVFPKIAATFFQVWLDHNREGIRII